MRALAALALPLLAALSGCAGVGASLDALDASQCAGHGVDNEVATNAQLLMPAGTPAEVADAFGSDARVNLTVSEGQQLVASATWQATAGDVHVAFDGSGGQVVESSTPNAWSWVGYPPAGDYVLELHGAPFAYGVTYTLSLVATGC